MHLLIVGFIYHFPKANITVTSILPLNPATTLSLLKEGFHNCMLVYAQSARKGNIYHDQNEKIRYTTFIP